jgi:DNA-binding transcriptional MerR regulator
MQYGLPMNQVPLFIDEKKVIELTGISQRTLRRWRANGTGPPWQYRGSSRFVMYSLQGLEEWLDRY